ncbi:4,5-dihydroxyphthalate decarboxylase [Actinoplanes regularis]|uniref:4,5-dihydroxyphthalate decarboxylase n=1 Tax=Actinoplanes regularis TaxID=52697 RepID=A0A239JGC0_9ACTN|nr:4,5-dihydroxyphthalate decarboxylase [Actinoplanes regularis]GIE92005.1 4,5-dihydroxyphthalate decarboxylase [Actinoplanes regularis]SNT04849.1 4,5-dihydroxyphthalate decarboxylase [Actinoplanes regularis]
MSISIALACERYDRTEALRDGRVTPAGVDLTYLPQQVEETFFRMARFREFDAAEMSLSSYVVGLTRDAPFIALPVFPSRMFRHSGIYVSTASGIGEPIALAGRRVGVAEYQLTANVWIRGLLADEYAVPVESVTYVTGGLHAPGRTEKVHLDLPPDVRVEPLGPGRTLAGALATGEIDALYSPRTPGCFARGDRGVRRLFEPARPVEEDYYRRTGIFPIMHVVVLRRDVYERDRWLARSLYDAFEQARTLCVEGIEETAAARYMLPWLHEEVARTRALLGDDYWPYGLEPNRHVLRTFLDYAYAQGLAARRLEPEELFAPETLESPIV